MGLAHRVELFLLLKRWASSKKLMISHNHPASCRLDIWRKKKTIVVYKGTSELNIGAERLAELPVWRCHIQGCKGLPIAGLDSKRQALAIQVFQALPVWAPVPGHGFPVTSFGPFNPYLGDLSSTPHIGYQNQFKVIPPIYGESHPSISLAWNPEQI